MEYQLAYFIYTPNATGPLFLQFFKLFTFNEVCEDTEQKTSPTRVEQLTGICGHIMNNI